MSSRTYMVKDHGLTFTDMSQIHTDLSSRTNPHGLVVNAYGLEFTDMYEIHADVKKKVYGRTFLFFSPPYKGPDRGGTARREPLGKGNPRVERCH